MTAEMASAAVSQFPTSLSFATDYPHSFVYPTESTMSSDSMVRNVEASSQRVFLQVCSQCNGYQARMPPYRELRVSSDDPLAPQHLLSEDYRPNFYRCACVKVWPGLYGVCLIHGTFDD